MRSYIMSAIKRRKISKNLPKIFLIIITSDHRRYYCGGFGRVLQVRAEIFSERTESDAREEVDGEPRVSRIIPGHQTFPSFRHRGVTGPGQMLSNISVGENINFYLSTNFVIPRNSASSWKSNLMKILELDVVSSSLSFITCKTSQPMASV